jgi:SecD/SecF fusion protein
VDIGRVVKLAGAIGLPDTTATVQTPIGGGAPTLRIETELTKDKSKGDFANLKKIVTALKKDYPEILKDKAATEENLMLNRESIGASVSGELRYNAIISVVLALVGIGIYVSLRFETGFGVAAMIATLHDVLMTIALFVFFGGQFNSGLIAAILLIIGYSVNDTIVVFDRIREELGHNPGRTLKDVIHFAINRTLSRTVLTSSTVFLCAVALWAFGAGDVRLYGEVFITACSREPSPRSSLPAPFSIGGTRVIVRVWMRRNFRAPTPGKLAPIPNKAADYGRLVSPGCGRGSCPSDRSLAGG